MYLEFNSYNIDGESKWISKIGHCACTDVNVTYGGEKFTTFAGSHSPIQIDITLSFKELELLNRQAVANESGTGVWPEGTYTKDAKVIPPPLYLMYHTNVGCKAAFMEAA